MYYWGNYFTACLITNNEKKCAKTSIKELCNMCQLHSTESEFLDDIQTEVLSFVLIFQFLQTHATSCNFYSSVTVH
jgi:hypothetical protein